jgi:DNA replication protein DnaC
MNSHLTQYARQLRLSGLLASLELRLQEARSNQLPHEQFLELIFQDELNVRQQRLIEKRKRAAGFRDANKTLEDFDWTFNPAIKRQPIYELATAQFVREHRDVLLMGPPGLGKSHLAQAIGYQAIKAGFHVLYTSIFDLVRELQADLSPAQMDRTLTRYLKPDLLIIDDMGLKVLPPKSGEVMLEVVMRRYEVRSTLMTSNRPIEEWGKLLNDVPASSAILDRLLHHADIIEVSGRSYRLHQAAQQKNKNGGLTTERKK